MANLLVGGACRAESIAMAAGRALPTPPASVPQAESVALHAPVVAPPQHSG